MEGGVKGEMNHTDDQVMSIIDPNPSTLTKEGVRIGYRTKKS